MSDSPLAIRSMQPEEARDVKAMARRVFPIQVMLFFSLTKHNLVAEIDGVLVGSVVLDTFAIDKGRKGGIVLYYFVDKPAQSRGVGRALAEAAIDFFEEQGCTDLFACVEGFNTPSARRWSQASFGILSPGDQFRRYGMAIPKVWYRTFHYIDVGHMLWARPPAESADRPWLQWWSTWLMNTILVALALWRQNAFQALPLPALALGALAVLVFLGVRNLAMIAAARAQGLGVRYRAWESGYPLGVAIAAVFGGYSANPGSLYPGNDDWRYRDLLPQLARMALAGVLPTLLLLAALRFWPLPAGAEGLMPAWRSIAIFVGSLLGFLDILVPFFPLESYNGRRIWDWNRWLWLVLALAMLALMFL